jgi:o-succinylbenzoate---CoA ligase
VKFSISAAAKECGDSPFIVSPARVLSFSDMAARVQSAQAWLQSNGVAPLQPQPFPIEAPLNLRTITLCLALFDIGVPALLLHPGWSPMERHRVLRQASLRAHPLPDSFARTTRHNARVVPLGEPSPEATLAVIYTSGSSAQPKGVCLSRRAFMASVRASQANLGWLPEDRWLLSLPLAHVGGLACLVRCLEARKAIVLPSLSAPTERLSAQQFISVIERSKVTLASLVPTQLRRLVELGCEAPPTLRAVLVGGASTPVAVHQRAVELGWPVLGTYGLTEACSQVTTQRLGATPQNPRSSGAPLPGVEVRVVDGHIQIRSQTLLSGYFPEDPPPLVDGWFATGDIGKIDESGELHVLGRADDVIVSGGENIHPEQVEEILLMHPLVRGVCVFGLPSLEWGETVAAVVCGDAGLALEELAEFTRSHLGAFKSPKYWGRAEELPLTASGKVSRTLVRQQLAERCRPLAPPAPPGAQV